jgi:hypothetical protein
LKHQQRRKNTKRERGAESDSSLALALFFALGYFLNLFFSPPCCFILLKPLLVFHIKAFTAFRIHTNNGANRDQLITYNLVVGVGLQILVKAPNS